MGGLNMTQYREILRLNSMNLSQMNMEGLEDGLQIIAGTTKK